MISAKAASFTESVIRDMTRLAIAHGAINLAQGFPDFACPQELKDAAKGAIDADLNQYAITWGAQNFREAIAAKFERTYGMRVNPDTQLCVTCGSTEAMIAAMLAVIDPGDEVVVLEPFYENYGPDAILSGATPRYVTLHEPDWTFDEGELAAAFNDRTRGIILNTPNNPTGKVFTRSELEAVGALCQKWGAVAFTDEIYEHMTYEGHEHVPLITIPGMEDRTVTINALSKTYSVTGWRVGWTVASPELTSGVRKVHDFLTVGAAAPLQEAGAVAMGLPDEYYARLAKEYLERRDLMLSILEGAGFKTYKPYGAYYIMTDISGLGFDDDVTAARHLTKEVGVASVPGSSFYSKPELGRTKLRFSFCKKLETLHAAGERLARP
ncbi:MAG: aminotransferase class I/II-fold pyridoxal phosphate-dependent enzyme [Actinomycetota bacterium]